MTRTETIDTLYSAVFAARRPELYDNIFNKRVLWAYLTAAGRVRMEDGGIHIEERLMYGENTTFGAIGRGGVVSVTPTDPNTLSKWEWRTVAGSILRYDDDEKKAKGKRAIANLVTENLENGEKSFIKEMNRQAFADGTGGGGLEIDGLDNIVATDPTTGTVGGINRATASNSWWRNKYKSMTSLPFQTYGVKWMRNMVNNCEDDGEELDLILTGQTLHEAYEAEVQGLQQVNPTEATRNKIADLGFRALYFKEIPIFYDKQIPVETKMYFLNVDYLRIVALTGAWFTMTDWKTIYNQPFDKIAQMLTKCNLVCSNSRRQGVLFNLS